MRHPDLPKKPGVYILYMGNSCVYVGGTIRIRQRVASHERTILFDRVEFVLCSVRELNELEEKYIAKLKPALNKETKAKGSRGNANREVLAFRVKRERLGVLQKLATSESRSLNNMVYVLIREALKARGFDD